MVFFASLAPATNERHFNLYSDASGTPAPMVFDPAAPEGTEGSGSFYINLQNFLTARDNNRQSVVDQMNLRATLFGNPLAGKPGITLPRPVSVGGSGTGINVTAADTVYFAGHSLGTITGMPPVFVRYLWHDMRHRRTMLSFCSILETPTEFEKISKMM